MSDPLVSILTPVYNGAEHLSASIDSALSQTYQNFELLIINDGSTDNTADIVRPYLTDPRIIYLERANGGVAAARNTGLEHAQGKYIAFLDQDDLWLPTKLALQVAALEQDEAAAFVYSNQDYIDDDGNKVDFPWVTGIAGHCFAALLQRNFISVLTVLIRKAVIDDVGRFNEQLAGTDDYELWLRVTLKYPIKYLDLPLALYRFHGSNFSKNKFKMTVLFLKALNTLFAEHPEAYRLVSTRELNARLFELHSQIGDWYSWYNQDYQQGRHYYGLALKNKPWALKTYRRFLFCCLSQPQRKALDWYWAKLKNWFS